MPVGTQAGLALFLVFVVMAARYESPRNPAVILLGVRYAPSGVAIGLSIGGLTIFMPVWLGIIMLIGVLRMVFGLSFSMFVTLLPIPSIYLLAQSGDPVARSRVSWKRRGVMASSRAWRGDPVAWRGVPRSQLDRRGGRAASQ